MPRRLLFVVLTAALVAATAYAQRDLSQVEIKTTKVAEGVFMMEGAGGNLGVCAGPDGVFLIDDQFAPLTDKIKAAIAKVSDRPIRFLLNTHWHGDHTGGNENFGKAGVLIVAHDNVRTRLSTEQFSRIQNRTIAPLAKEGLPVVTFSDTVTFHMNGHTVVAFHVPPAHTDGDAIIKFTEANVVHMGDCFFNGTYPVIDLGAGGSLAGMIAAGDRVLAMVNAQTRIIPGHGPLGDKVSLQAFRNMLVQVREKVLPLVKQGKTADEIVAAKPTAALDEKWGKGFMTPERFLRVVVEDLGGK